MFNMLYVIISIISEGLKLNFPFRQLDNKLIADIKLTRSNDLQYREFLLEAYL